MPAETERRRQKCSLHNARRQAHPQAGTPGDWHTSRPACQQVLNVETTLRLAWGMDVEPRLWGPSRGVLLLGRSLQASGNWKHIQSLCPDSELGPQAEGSDASVNLTCPGLGSCVNR